MRNSLLKIVITTCIILSISFSMQAAEGDTTKIRVHDAVHMNWWGEYSVWGMFPAPGTSFRRINLDFTLGCPPTGCSDWDYTVQVEAVHHTGTYDSLLVQTALYTTSTSSGPPTIYANQDTVYVTFYDTTAGVIDSVPATMFWIFIYNNPNDPFQITDSMYVFAANYYNYLFGPGGTIIDSVFVGADLTLTNVYTNAYFVWEVIEYIELARVITPYGGYYPLTWSNTIHFDITDLAPILHDSVEIRAFYSGWSDGFSLTLDFNFIEGIPPRTPVAVKNVYTSFQSGYPYGNIAQPIESFLTTKSIPIALNETNALLRFIPTGHGAGSQNCAEFCLKNYQVDVGGIQQFQQAIWRNDCGLNHLIHQAGTWIYDRANWCPGEKGLIHEHELTPFITPGNPVSINIDLDPYTNTMSGQNPNYIIAAHVITFGNPNFTNDASMEEIIAPNSDYYYNRRNPICNNPVVVIKNTGSGVLNSVNITYGIRGATPSIYNWNGSLEFNETAIVQLGSIDWNSSTNQPDQFYAFVSDPNSSSDQYAWNDTMSTYLNFPQQYPSTFVLLFKSNLAYTETSYNIKDDQGNVVFTNGILSSNTIFRDTVTLAPGCYSLNVTDTDKDGLNFFANNDGAGYIRFVNAYGPGVLKYFEADFGTRFSHQFTIGYLLNTPEIESQTRMNVFPNPVGNTLTVDLALPRPEKGTISITDVSGRVIINRQFAGTDNPVITMDVTHLDAGIYLVTASTGTSTYTKRIVVQP